MTHANDDENSSDSVYSEEEVAHHEAGHAFMAFKVRRAIRKLSIVPDDASLGRLLTVPLNWRDAEWSTSAKLRWKTENEAMVLLGGPIAHLLYLGKPIEASLGGGEYSDMEAAQRYISDLCGDMEETDAYVNWLSIRTRNALRSPHQWYAVQHLASELMIRREMSGRLVRKTILDGMTTYTDRLRTRVLS